MMQFKIEKPGKGKSELLKSPKLEEGMTIPRYQLHVSGEG